MPGERNFLYLYLSSKIARGFMKKTEGWLVSPQSLVRLWSKSSRKQCGTPCNWQGAAPWHTTELGVGRVGCIFAKNVSGDQGGQQAEHESGVHPDCQGRPTTCWAPWASVWSAKQMKQLFPSTWHSWGCTCLSLETSLHKSRNNLRQLQNRAMKVVWGIDHEMFNGKLRELGLINLLNWRLKGKI